jgi:hypothetical protein
MEKYKRVKVLGKGSFGCAVLVTLAKDPTKKFVVVGSPPGGAHNPLTPAAAARPRAPRVVT